MYIMFGELCVCESSSKCTTCANGYYLTTYDTCASCSNSFLFCETCNLTSCISCRFSNYVLYDGQCIECSYSPCTQCNILEECVSCSFSTGYCLDSSECVLQSEYNCGVTTQKCRGGTCTSCANGYFLSTNNKCDSCQKKYPYCSTCDSETCQSCVVGYHLSTLGTCIKCENCGEAGCSEDGTVCFDCQPDYIIQPNGKCVFYSTVHCSLALYGRCIECESGYSLIGGNCLQNTICSETTVTLLNGSCVEQQNDLCATGFNIEGVCVNCQQSYDHCTHCVTVSTGQYCSVCSEGYYPHGPDCQSCKSIGCLTCSNRIYDPKSTYNKTCTKCLDGYYLDDDSCFQIKHCDVINGNTCEICSTNYIKNNDGLCISYITVNHCMGASNNYCSSCDVKYYIDPITHTCLPCGSSECETCNSATNCTLCYAPSTLSEGVCKTCDILNCVTCSRSSYTCDSCNPGYYLNSDNFCTSCSETFSHCSICSSSHCTICSNNYYLDSLNQCQECSTMVGCLICSPKEERCLTCLSDEYYLDSVTSTCISCSILSGCKRCSNAFACTECNSNYYLDGARCQQCNTITGCATCSSLKKQCLSCLPTYKTETSVDGSIICKDCQTVQPNCETCDSSFRCSTCNNRFTRFTDGTCVSCSDSFNDCSVCSQTSYSCLQCSTKEYYVNSTTGKCISCYLNTNGSCQTCDSPTHCLSCASNYYLNSSSCIPCSTILNCESCTSNGLCTRCSFPYTPTPNGCVSCSLIIPHCSQCTQTGNTCRSCEKGYYLSSNKCIECSTQISHCAECDSGSECKVCENDYYLKDKMCYLCSEITECILCSPDKDGCLLCSNNALPENGKCSKCSQILCDVCEDYNICTSCSNGNYLSNEGICTNCNLMSGCSVCNTTSESCVTCHPGFYLNDKNQCEPCGRDCSQCLSNTHCITCNKKYVLQDNGSCSFCSDTIVGCSQCNQNKLSCDICDINYFKRDDICSPCTEIHPNCNSCEYDNESGKPICTICSLNTVVKNNTCSSCEVNEYIEDGKCVKCNEIMNNCVLCENNEKGKMCKRCESGYGFNSDKSACIQCSGVIDQLGYCVLCEDKNCLVCNETNYCIKCISNSYILRNGICTYFDDTNCLFKNEIIGCENCKTSISLTGICSNKSQNEMCSFYYKTSNTNEICNYYYHNQNNIMINGICTTNINCKTQIGNDCVECNDGYYLKNNNCIKCESHCNKCYLSNNGSICYLCEENYGLINGECKLLDEIHCSSIEKEKTFCSDCNKQYYLDNNRNCQKITINDCIYSRDNINCLKCSSNKILTRNNNGEFTCGKILPDNCEQSNENGCLRCSDGFFLLNNECSKCDDNCNTCYGTKTQCITCNFGYTLDTNYHCNFIGEQVKKCKTFLPNAQGCAVCKDGYYYKNKQCYECDVSCSTCVLNSKTCTTCNVSGSYFYDNYKKNCQHISSLTHCINITSTGCSECEPGYYINNQYCSPCLLQCATCSNNFECDSCPENYVLTSESYTYKNCLYYTNISHCTSAKESKCSSCEENYQLLNDGTCEIKQNYFIVIGIPIIICIIITLIIIICIGSIVLYITKKQKTRNSINKTKLDFQFDYNEETFIPVGMETRDIICIGNEKCHLLKIQLSTKENTNKFSIRTSPQLVSLKKGKACEFEIFIKPLCTCVIDEYIVISCLDIKRGIKYYSEIKVKCETEITSRLDPDELKEDKKLGEGSFGIVYLGKYRGNKVAIKKMKQISESDMNREMKEFKKETDMLDKFRNEYIVHFYGAVFIPKKICMVTEFAEYGLNYLHSNGILHRDIKPDNILVFSLDTNIKINAKLTDFGSARNVNLLMTNMTFTKGIGTPVYMAPEVLNKEHYKTPADIYSFAITMFETIKWDNPYSKEVYKFPWTIASAVVEGKRPDISSYEPNLKHIIDMCWKQEPKERFISSQIVTELTKYFTSIGINDIYNIPSSEKFNDN
ncbi:protein serine/threonine kinase, putative [Entamoeba dispar SAW760]|uniref:Protein serine/threonine kinase, putative n=1 Tax=Entamoeba dispar (strain ATCC PRA-260 / SAW760) TaxID=370354 RepID=B0EAL6_ENTDS|nr:protein serine/threonine kinase, putative [Entamoeba dispar SAW760]EDR28439.1 protein serine/threonine kinase, putative [Entamoeba dispar SAW760]|eukprot:EDR28439.1 protein serine/threonine kinase, putative [Entamoeba dispar SAW760]